MDARTPVGTELGTGAVTQLLRRNSPLGGATQDSRSSEIAGREPCRINRVDATARGITDGDIVVVGNDRGKCLAGAVLTDMIRPGMAQLPTGAWYDPLVPGENDTLDKHGNPNALTQDRGTSKLGQGPSAQGPLVEIARLNGPAPPVTAFSPPVTLETVGVEVIQKSQRELKVRA
jgi:biotin/methionine sulfoxide reductase